MNTFSDSAATALRLITQFDPVLLSIVARSLAVSATACALAYGLGLVPVSYTHLTLPTNREV